MGWTVFHLPSTGSVFEIPSRPEASSDPDGTVEILSEDFVYDWFLGQLEAQLPELSLPFAEARSHGRVPALLVANGERLWARPRGHTS